jgi:gag-polypeptide of LTR copia-type
MKIVLMTKDLWDIVDGLEVQTRGVDKDKDVEWEKKNQKALALTSLSLTPIGQHHILDCTSVKAAWGILEKVYQGKGRNRKFR